MKMKIKLTLSFILLAAFLFTNRSYAQTQGSISGEVIGPDRVPIAGMEVVVLNAGTSDFVNSTITDANGTYLFTELPADSYIVGVDTGSTNFLNEFYNNVTNIDFALPVKVIDGEVITGINFILELGGSISGKVLDSTNQPIPNMHVDVEIFDTGTWINSGKTDATGNYSVSGIPTGKYRVITNTEGTPFTTEYFNNVTNFNLAFPVSVTAGKETTDINFVLEAGGSISGTVMSSSSQPVSGIFIDVELFDTGVWVNSAKTDINGNYLVPGISTGKYRVSTNAEGTSFINEYFDNVTDFDLATPVPVTVGINTPDINFVLDAGGSIAGSVVDSTNQPIPGIFIDVFMFDAGTWVNSGQTDSTGNYSISGIPIGKYRVGTNAEGTSFTNEFFDNAKDHDLASPVSVTTGNTTFNINFTLDAGGSISGSVLNANGQPVPAVFVDVIMFDSDVWINSGQSDATGNYSISGIPTGKYRVKTNAKGTNFINEYFNNVTDFDLASAVSVTAGIDTANINFVLDTGGSISGTVLSANIRPIPDIFIEVELFDTGIWVNSAQTDVNGNFSISGIPTGKYRVKTNAEGTNFTNEYFDNVKIFDLASPVAVTAGNNTQNINFVLDSGGSLSGNISDSSNRPIPNIFVDVEIFDTNVWVNSGKTDASGNYSISGLPTGKYRIRTNAEGTNFTNEYFDNVTNFNLASAVSVTAGNNTPNINFILDSGGSLSGNISDSSNRHIPNIFVDVEIFDTNVWVNSGQTDASGNYSVSGLPTGKYRVRTNAEGTNFSNEYFDNVSDFDNATPVSVTAGNNTLNINFVLDSGGSISGNVLDADNKPVAGININAEDFDGNFHVNSAKTNLDGNYAISGLPTGTYKVGIDTFGTDFVPQFYNNTVWDTATPVKVNTPGDTPGINFILQKGNFIRGKVTKDDNTTIAGISIDAVNAESGQWVNSGISDSKGNYFITVAPGSYKVNVSTSGTKFLPEFYNNATTFENATVVTVAAGKDALNIDFTLSTGNIIKGKITGRDNNPIKGLFVNLMDSSTREWVNGSETDRNGEYSISVLPGTYFIQVETFGTNFAPASQDNLVVKEGKDNLGVNFILSTANSIKGKVVDSNGIPFADMFVSVSDSVTEDPVNFGITKADGTYSIPVLPGTYFVEVDTFGTKFIQVERKTVTVIDGTDTSGIDFVLKVGNVIRGKVTDKENARIKGLFVSAFEFKSGFWVGGGESDANGDYEIAVLPGIYKVGVDAFDTVFAPEMFNGKGWDNADQVVVQKGADTVNIDFNLAPASFITGTITDKDGNPLKNILVDVSDFETGFWVGFGETNTDGVYRAAVRPGSYVVNTFAREQGFADKYYNDKTNFDEADRVDLLVESETISGIDFVLASGGSISGNVTDGSVGISGIEVNAFEYNNDSWINDGITDETGNYTIKGLPTGAYRIRAEDPSGRFPGVFFGGSESVLSWELAVAVNTVNGEDRSGINLELPQGGSIKGSVTDGTNPLADISVEAFEFNTGLWINASDTDSTGNYTITLPEGEFRVRAFDNEGKFPSEYFDNVGNWNEADPVTVTIGKSNTGTNFTLSEASFISGEVQDNKNKLLKGINIEVFDFDSDDWINVGISDQNGKYKIPVRPGKYRVGAIPFDPGFTPVFFNSLAGNVPSWDDASPVSVTASNNAANINFKLLRGGIIAGQVKDNNGNGMPKINVQAFDFDTDSWINDGFTGSTGNYNVSVPEGRYRVRAVPIDSTSSLSGEFYDNEDDWDSAKVVNVTIEQTITLNDIVLSTGNSISGLVTDDNKQPIVGANVEVFNYDTDSWINSAVTDRQGKYIVKGLKNSDYRIQAFPQDNENLIPQFYDNTASWDNARRVRINSSDKNNINFTLSSGGLITGRVTDEDSNSTVCGIEIDAFDIDSGSWINSDITDSSGNYSIKVQPGTYFVRATAKGTDYIDEYFEDTLEQDDAKPVVVTIDKNANVNLKLSKGGKITGTVKDNSNSGISGAEVNAFDFDTNEWINNSVTDSDGKFAINSPSGSFRLYIKAPFDSNFIDEYYDNTVNFSASAPVNVTVPDETTVSDIILDEGRGTVKGNIKGTIGSSTVALEGVKINVIEFNTDTLSGIDFTDDKGDYSISVTPGKYRLFSSFEGTTTSFINKFYNNALTAGSATAINIEPSGIETADFTLTTGQNIQGRVRSSDTLTPIAGVEVVAFKFDTAEWAGSDKTDTTGSYSINVSNGTYKIWALPGSAAIGDVTFKSQFYSNTESFDSAKKVIVNDTAKSGINFDLLPAEDDN